MEPNIIINLKQSKQKIKHCGPCDWQLAALGFSNSTEIPQLKASTTAHG